MKIKIASHRLSYLASFSYFLFGSVALAHTNTLISNSTIQVFLLSASVTYALFAVIAYFHVLRPPKNIDSPVLSLPVQQGIRVVALAIPLPFVVLYAAVLTLSGTACGAGIVGELLESAGRFDMAKACYQQRLHLHQALDSKQVICDLATMGSICDKQHSYGQADQYYQEAERLVPFAPRPVVVKKDPFFQLHYLPPTFEAVSAADWYEQPWRWRPSSNAIDPWPTSMTTMALPRILRLLNQIPEAKARDEFELAGWALAHRGESSLMLGRHFGKVDLRPHISDFRTAPDEFQAQIDSPIEPATSKAPHSVAAAGGAIEAKDTQSHSDATAQPSSGTIGPQGIGATCVMGVNCAGFVIHGEQLRMMLGKMPRETALANFDFASKFYPGAQVRHKREDFPQAPLPGTFLKPTTVRELIPDDVLILGQDEHAKLCWLGRNAKSPREIDVVLTDNVATKTEWIDWIKKRASDSGFTARIAIDKAATPVPTIPGQLRVGKDGVEIPEINGTSTFVMAEPVKSFYESSVDEFLSSEFETLKSSFDEGLRAYARLHYCKPSTLKKWNRIQLFVDRHSDPLKLSDKDLNRIKDKGHSLGLTVTYQDDRDEGALFSRDELDHWAETATVTVSLEDRNFSTEVRGPIAASGWGYLLTSNDAIVDNIEQSIELSQQYLRTDCNLSGDSFSSAAIPSERVSRKSADKQSTRNN